MHLITVRQVTPQRILVFYACFSKGNRLILCTTELDNLVMNYRSLK